MLAVSCVVLLTVIAGDRDSVAKADGREALLEVREQAGDDDVGRGSGLGRFGRRE